MTVKIIILACNRLHYLLETLQSVLKQKLDKPYTLSIVVSDNSTNSDTEKHFSLNTYPNVKYIRRYPPVSSGIEHLNIILREVDTDFFMMFHDDDIMGENMIAKSLASFTPSTVAVSSNAYVLSNDQKTTQKLVQDEYTPIPITTKKELLDCFMLRRGGPPFPSYIYRCIVSQLHLDPKYKKHGDVHFISRILDFGSIYFIKEPLFYYRLHCGQDSFYSDFIGMSRLVSYSIKECGYSRKDKSIINWRLTNIYGEYRVQLLMKDAPSFKRMFYFMLLCAATYNITLMGKLIVRYVQCKISFFLEQI